MPLRTVLNILKIYENTKDVRLPRRGRRCRVGVIQGDIWAYLEQLIIHDPSLFLDEIQEALLVRFNRKFSLSTISATMRRHDYTWKKLRLMSTR